MNLIKWLINKISKKHSSIQHDEMYDSEFCSLLVQNAHKISRDKETIIKYKDKYYRIRELG